MRFLDFQLDDAIANAGGTKILYKTTTPNYTGFLGVSCTEYYVINVIALRENESHGPYSIYKSNGFWYANGARDLNVIVFYFAI